MPACGDPPSSAHLVLGPELLELSAAEKRGLEVDEAITVRLLDPDAGVAADWLLIGAAMVLFGLIGRLLWWRGALAAELCYSSRAYYRPRSARPTGLAPVLRSACEEPPSTSPPVPDRPAPSRRRITI